MKDSQVETEPHVLFYGHFKGLSRTILTDLRLTCYLKTNNQHEILFL